jgi:hypothetical protein
MADQCRPVVSSWAEYICLVNGEVAIQFKPHGVCCLYPGTTAMDFNALAAAASKGRFVWHVLPYRHPYRLIKSPCKDILFGPIQTLCCANALPRTLHLTVTDLGGCACMAGTFALHYDPRYANPTWTNTSAGTCAGGTMSWLLDCSGSAWGLQGSNGSETVGAGSPSSTTCDPLDLVWDGASALNWTSACSGSVKVEVTT